MDKYLLIPVLFILMSSHFVGAEDTGNIQLRHRDTTEYRTTDIDGGECQLTFDLTGHQITDALDAGRWKIDTATDNTGVTLSALPGFRESYTPLQKLPIAKTPGTIATVKLGLTISSRAARSIKILEGSLGINVYRRQIVIIEELEQNRNSRIENPLFKTHGFTVQLIDPQHAYPGYSSEAEKNTLLSRAVAFRIEGDIDKVDSFKLVGPDGTELPSRPAGFGAGRSRTMARMADAPLPAGTTAHLLIPIDPKEIRIPFSFTDIPLP